MCFSVYFQLPQVKHGVDRELDFIKISGDLQGKMQITLDLQGKMNQKRYKVLRVYVQRSDCSN